MKKYVEIACQRFDAQERLGGRLELFKETDDSPKNTDVQVRCSRFQWAEIMSARKKGIFKSL